MKILFKEVFGAEIEGHLMSNDFQSHTGITSIGCHPPCDAAECSSTATNGATHHPLLRCLRGSPRSHPAEFGGAASVLTIAAVVVAFAVAAHCKKGEGPPKEKKPKKSKKTDDSVEKAPLVLKV